MRFSPSCSWVAVAILSFVVPAGCEQSSSRCSELCSDGNILVYCGGDRPRTVIYDGCRTPLDAGSDSSADAGPRCTPEPAVETLASTASVRFRVRDAGWIVREGVDCSGFAISSEARGPELALRSRASCGCEPCEASIPHASTLARVGDGVAELVWDGRAFSSWRECSDACPDRLGLQGSAERPAAPGRYLARLRIYDELPEGCTDVGDGTATCAPPTAGTAGLVPTLCGGGRELEVLFDLPSSGELVVEVDATL